MNHLHHKCQWNHQQEDRYLQSTIGLRRNVNKTTDYVGILGRKTDVIFIIIFKTNNEIDTIQHLIIIE